MWTVACFFYGQWRWYMYSHSNPQKNTLHRYHLPHIWEIILYYYTEHTLGIVFQFAMTTYSHLERLTTVNNAHEKLWLANQLHYTYLGKEWGFVIGKMCRSLHIRQLTIGPTMNTNLWTLMACDPIFHSLLPWQTKFPPLGPFKCHSFTYIMYGFKLVLIIKPDRIWIFNTIYRGNLWYSVCRGERWLFILLILVKLLTINVETFFS